MHRLTALTAFLTSLAATATAQQTPASIDTLALRAHTYFLSHDLLEGRGTGTRGGRVASLYLATAAARIGLTGAIAGGFYQDVPLEAATIDTVATTLTLTARGPSGESRTVFHAPAEFLPNAGTAATLVSFAGSVVYLGSASDVLAHADRLPPLAGRVALMAGTLGGFAAAADTLRAHGATGILQGVATASQYDLFVASRGLTRVYARSEDTATSFAASLPAVLVHPDVVRRLIAGADTFRVQVTESLATRTLPARNVVALVRGSDPALRGEVVVFSAHYDHLGFSTPDASGDSIYNGFSDNAAGSAMLLAIAQVVAASPPPRSVLFLWTTGEEMGLLGSDWFVAHPAVPLDSIVAVINLDAGAPPGLVVTWNVQGGVHSSLGPTAAEVAHRHGWEVHLQPATPNSDHYPFHRAGIPTAFLVPAPAAYEGMTTEASRALQRHWDHYHQPADEWRGDFPFAGLARYAGFALELGLEVARGPRPAMTR